MKNPLDKAVQELKEAREALGRVSKSYEERREELLNDPEFRALENALEVARVNTKQRDEELRLQALAMYENTSTKNLHGKVKIKVMRTVAIHATGLKLVNYAKRHVPDALSVNKVLLKRYVRNVIGVTDVPSDIASVTLTPTAQISKTL